jgi:hypothetical protein
MPRPLSHPSKDPVPIVQEVGWAPGPVWTGAENLAPTGIQTMNCPACSSVAILTELPGPHRPKYLPLYNPPTSIFSPGTFTANAINIPCKQTSDNA